MEDGDEDGGGEEQSEEEEDEEVLVAWRPSGGGLLQDSAFARRISPDQTLKPNPSDPPEPESKQPKP